MVCKNILLNLQKIISLAIISITILAFQNQPALAKKKIFVIANVNNQVITNIDLRQRYNFFLKTTNIKINSKSEKLFILNQLIQKLIEENLQITDAKSKNVTVEQEELNKTLANIAKSQGRSMKEVKTFFRSNNISYSHYTNQIKTQLLWNKIANKALTPKIKITKSEIDETLELNKINTKQTKLKLAEIFIPFKNKKERKESLSLAKKLLTEINEGGDFKNIARQFSKSASNKFDGEIGWITQTDLDSKIYNKIKNIKIGENSQTIKARNGYYIFKILDRKIVENIAKKDEEQIRSIIFNRKLKIAAKSYLRNLKKKSYIKIYQDNLKLI